MGNAGTMHHFTTRDAQTEQSLIEDLGIKSWNIHGLSQEKLDILNDYLQRSRIICFSETWSYKNDVYKLKSYEYYPFCRTYKHVRSWRPAGGQAIL